MVDHKKLDNIRWEGNIQRVDNTWEGNLEDNIRWEGNIQRVDNTWEGNLEDSIPLVGKPT